MSTNRRISQRHNVVLQASLDSDGETADAVIEDLSLGGAQVIYPRRLPMGKRIKVSFALPGRPEPIKVGAVVRWVKPDSIGLQFEGLRARDVWSLNKYFEKLD